MSKVSDGPVRARLTRADLILLVLNTIVGAGVVALPGRAFALAGSQAFTALAIAAAAAMVIAVAFCRLARSIPGPGGPYLYVRSTLGKAPALATMAFLIPTRLLATAASLIILADAFQSLAGDTARSLALLVAPIVFTLLAFTGVLPSIRVGNLLGVFKLLLLASIAVAAFLWLALGAAPITHPPADGPQALAPAILL